MSKRFLALLGSINVGGNRIKMVDLKAAMTKARFGEVTTVAASGNVILEDARAPRAIEASIEDLLRDQFGFNSCVMVRSQIEVQAAINENPFHGVGSDKKVHCVFLAAQPEEGRFEALVEECAGKGEEKLAMGERVLFVDYVNGVGTSALTARFLEQRLGVKGTARNMNSLKNILKKMGE